MKETDYVTYETAKLLAKIGFPKHWVTTYKNGELVSARNGMFGELSAPSLWEAMQWLRESRDLFIQISQTKDYSRIGYPIGVPCIEYLVTLIPMFKGERPLSATFSDYCMACNAGVRAACIWLIQEDIESNGL